MPGYRVHDRSTLIAALLAGGVYAAISRSASDAAILAGFTVLSGTLLSPDLDVFANPSWKYALAPYGNTRRRLGKVATGARDVCRFGVVSGSKALDRWGPLRIIWMPYRLALFSWWLVFGNKSRDTNFGHRSIWSHTPVVADILRLSYLTVVACAAGGLVLQLLRLGDGWTVWHLAQGLAAAHRHAVLLALAGCSIATTVHYALDFASPD